MAQQLALIEKNLKPYLPAFDEVLKPTGVPATRIVRTLLMACERNNRLLECSQSSLISCGMTASVLGLEVDGVTGQGFVVPYNVKGNGLTAQFQIGYKGYPTMAARAGLTVNSGVVREGDLFDYEEGTSGFVKHKRQLGDDKHRRIMAAWATASAIGRPPIVTVMSYDDVLAIKARSPGAKKQDSPWNDYNGPGHVAMVQKTPVRRLGRSIPISAFQMAAAMEDRQDMGQAAFLRPDGAMTIDGDIVTGDYPQRAQPQGEEDDLGLGTLPAAIVAMTWNGEKEFTTIEAWRAFLQQGVAKFASDPAALIEMRQMNLKLMEEHELNPAYQQHVKAVRHSFSEALGED